MKFDAELEKTGKTTAGFAVPAEVLDLLGGGGHPKVVVTVAGYSFRTSIAKMGGRYLLGVSAARRDESGITTGQVHSVDVRLDTAPRVVEMPEDLAVALAAEPTAQAFWEVLSYSVQSWHVLQVTSAKKAETRANRVAKSVAMLAEGRVR